MIKKMGYKKIKASPEILSYKCNCLVLSRETICFLDGIFTFSVCLWFKFKIFNHECSEKL